MTNEETTQAVDEIVEELTIVNPLGLHARPAAALVQTVLQFKSDVYISLNGHRVNAKSIMGLLTLAAACGSVLMFSCKGSDARQAMDAVRTLIESGFGEV
ncbi:MAG: HPr family phosphocarrier protein [Candidatus Hydrogenedentes bacterium]|nr:HPr family phosphocarrier protein [Candidatus Hydrogenedentota bacterium]